MSPCPLIASVRAGKAEDNDDDDDDQKHKTSVLHVDDYEQRWRCMRDKRAIAGSCSLTHQPLRPQSELRDNPKYPQPNQIIPSMILGG